MQRLVNSLGQPSNRRSFLRMGMAAATVGGALLGGGLHAFADEGDDPEEKNGHLSKGDAAILRFAAAAMPIPQPGSSGMFGHPPYRYKGCCHGGSKLLDGYGAFHRPTACVS